MRAGAIFCAIVLGMFVLTATPAFAQSEPQVMEIRHATEAPVLDGKWTTQHEWDQAGEKLLSSTVTEYGAALRTMYDDDYVYMLVDFYDDQSSNRDYDVFLACFDTMSDGGQPFQPDDYCFVLNDFIFKSGRYVDLYRGKGSVFTRVDLPQGFDARIGFSSVNSPYEPTRNHRIYEMRVPLEFLHPAQSYGLFVLVVDGGSGSITGWPPGARYSKVELLAGGNYTEEYVKCQLYANQYRIYCPSAPETWGQLSSTTVMPEFPLPALAAAAAIAGTIALARLRRAKPW